MDYLFVNIGECDDRLREREFYLVQNCTGLGDAAAKLSAHFLGDENTAEEEMDNWAVFLSGENIRTNGFFESLDIVRAIYPVL